MIWDEKYRVPALSGYARAGNLRESCCSGSSAVIALLRAQHRRPVAGEALRACAQAHSPWRQGSGSKEKGGHRRRGLLRQQKPNHGLGAPGGYLG